MIVKPNIVERRTTHDVTDEAARRVAGVARTGVAVGVGAMRMLRAAYLGFLAVVSGLSALGMGLFAGNPVAFLGLGAISAGLAWATQRQFKAALSGR